MSRKSDAIERTKKKYITEIDEGELTVILVEAIAGLTRPQGLTFAQVLVQIPDDDRIAFAKGARAAVEYFRAQINKMERVN